MSIRLSICIPTFNRGMYLNDALESISQQEGLDVVEIVISDNASNDGTEHIVEHWRSKLPHLVYFRWDSNQGADQNFLKVIEIASGEYCWLLGSDDLLAAGAVAELLPHLIECDILLLDYQLMSPDMGTILESRRALSAAPGSSFQLQKPEDLQAYLRLVRDMTGLFAYISTVVVQRSSWTSVSTRSEFIGSAWIHVTKLMDVFRGGGRLKYIGKPLVLNRTGNDSFLAEVGHTRRSIIDLDYVRICRRVFNKEPAMMAYLLAWLEEWFFSWRAVLGIKYSVMRIDGQKGLNLITPVLFSAFQNGHQYWLKRAGWQITPIWLLNGLQRFVRWRRRANIHGSHS